MSHTSLVSLRQVLVGALATSVQPSERDIAALLQGTWPAADASHRLLRYHRKIDVARRVMAAYDRGLDKATSDQEVCEQGYLGLALAFADAAASDDGADPTARARRLRWINSVFNSLDHVTDIGHRPDLDELNTALLGMLQEAVGP